MKKTAQKYTVAQIKKAIKYAYGNESHRDDWNVPVFYETHLLSIISKYLKKTDLTR